jgi:hypothetical protein
VDGRPTNPVAEAQPLLEHAGGNFIWLMLQGVGHGSLHSGFGGGECVVGPWLIGWIPSNNISKVYMLLELEWFARGNHAAKDYITHCYEDLHPTGLVAPSDTTGVVSINYKDAAASGTVIIDDYQSNPTPGLSSSGGTVTYDVSNLTEGNLNGDTNFDFTVGDPFNGCENMEGADPPQMGVVFDWTSGEQKFYRLDIVPGQQDFSARTFFSMRAAQGTRHPETVALNGPLFFTVELRDAAGHTGAIRTQAYGGIKRPYQRGGYGTGLGWFNEWSTMRIRLADFENDNTQLDLAHVVSVTLKFGSASGSARGRLAVDQIELTNE